MSVQTSQPSNSNLMGCIVKYSNLVLNPLMRFVYVISLHAERRGAPTRGEKEKIDKT